MVNIVKDGFWLVEEKDNGYEGHTLTAEATTESETVVLCRT
jgi:hypothetical protein